MSSIKHQVYGRALKITAVLGGFIAAILRDMALGNSERKQEKRAEQLKALLGDLGWVHVLKW